MVNFWRRLRGERFSSAAEAGYTGPTKADGAGECEIGQEAASTLRDRHVNLPIPDG